LFSARKALAGDSGQSSRRFDGLVWAAGWTSSAENCPLRAPLVMDLEYKEDSPAREFAVIHGLTYVSGKDLFARQANLQQQFWSSR